MSNSIPQILCDTRVVLPDSSRYCLPDAKVHHFFGVDPRRKRCGSTADVCEIGIKPGDRTSCICMEKTLDQVSVILGVVSVDAVVVLSRRR